MLIEYLASELYNGVYARVYVCVCVCVRCKCVVKIRRLNYIIINEFVNRATDQFACVMTFVSVMTFPPSPVSGET